MAQIKQRDLFVRRLSIYRVRIWRKDFEVDFKFTNRPMQDSMHVRECTTVLESGLHAVDFQIPVLDSSSFFKLELGFRIPIVVGFRIPWAGFRILKPRIPFRKQNFPAQHGVIRVRRIMLPK